MPALPACRHEAHRPRVGQCTVGVGGAGVGGAGVGGAGVGGAGVGGAGAGDVDGAGCPATFMYFVSISSRSCSSTFVSTLRLPSVNTCGSPVPSGVVGNMMMVRLGDALSAL